MIVLFCAVFLALAAASASEHIGKVQSALDMGPSFLVSCFDTLGNLGSTCPGKCIQVLRYHSELPEARLLRTACPILLVDTHVDEYVDDS